MIYADNAATTKMSDAAVNTMTKVIRETWGNPSSLYQTGQRAKEELEAARSEVAAAIGAEAREIVFTSGGSEADNHAIRSAAELGKKKGKTHIISTAIEHHAVLHTLKRLEAEGFTVTLLPVHENGIVDASEVEAAITDETCLVTIMFANNEIGSIQPIREIGALCRARAFCSTPMRCRRWGMFRWMWFWTTSISSRHPRTNSTARRASVSCMREKESSLRI